MEASNRQQQRHIYLYLNCQFSRHLMQRWREFRPAGLRSGRGYIYSCKFNKCYPLVLQLSFSQHLAPSRSLCLLNLPEILLDNYLATFHFKNLIINYRYSSRLTELELEAVF